LKQFLRQRYLDDNGEEDGEPGLGPQVVEDEADQRIRRLKIRKKSLSKVRLVSNGNEM